MHKASWQATILVLLATGIAHAAPQGPYSRQLAAECDALIDLAVKRAFGWGWTGALEREPTDRRPVVAMQPPGTPAAGFGLLLAGSLLEDPKYTQAAVNVSRGLVAAQTTNGNILADPSFGMKPGGREPPAAVPQRAPTSAGIVLLLATIGVEPERDDMFRRAALRAARWLESQQADDGGWPSGSPRVIRLDSSDYRDSTCALMLTANRLNDRAAANAAAKSVGKLISLRLGGPGAVGNLWFSSYRLNGATDEPAAPWPLGADALASRRAAETLLAAAMLNENEDARIAARDAAKLLATLQGDDGMWQRIFPLHGTLPATNETVFQSTTTASSDDPAERADFGLASLVAAVELMQKQGRGPLSAAMSRGGSLQERLATAICRLDDGPFATDWPRNRADLGAYLQAHEARWRLLAGSPPQDLDERVRRLYVLLVRARLEIEFEQEH